MSRKNTTSSASPIPWSRIKALSFDIYGTLIDWENGIASAARATALGPYLPDSHADLLYAIERHDTTVQREFPGKSQSEVIAEGLRRYADELGVISSKKLTPEQVDAACKDYGAKIGSYPAFSDTVAAMQRLGARFKLVPLSNVDGASFSLTCAGPLKGVKFDAVYTAQDIGSYKPDLRNFRYLIDGVKRDFGVDETELVHVAQSLFHDHQPGAKGMGLQSVWVDRRGFMGNPTRVSDEESKETFGWRLKVDTLAELADLIDAEVGGSGA